MTGQAEAHGDPPGAHIQGRGDEEEIDEVTGSDCGNCSQEK